ncbi:MAG: hypothetical protein JKY31_01405 [Rhodobacteraceae bacterium]|nr:hypothetical protein [Paracoccaceae bacterium]
MPGPELSARWKKAKVDFHKITGEKKPKPKGFVSSTLGHSGIDACFKKADKYCAAIETENDLRKRAKLIAAGEKFGRELDSTVKAYIKFAKGKMKDEEADRNQRTTYTKSLDFLADRLDHLDQLYDQFLDSRKIAMDNTLSGMAKVTKMMYKSLSTTVANAYAGIKKIKSNPNPEQFMEIFGGSDNIMRKVQVQMVQAAIAQKKGLIPPDLMIDPRFIADKMTPWQAGGTKEAVCGEDWDDRQILGQTAKAERLIQICERFLNDLREKAPR